MSGNETAPAITGGCQCGAVRYRLSRAPETSICFCRMCQKAVGNYFGAFAGVDDADLAWTRGKPSVFASSEAAERGFCQACGTPLTFAYRGSGRISVSAGSLDYPAAFPPDHAYGSEGRPGWFDELCSLPASRTQDDVPETGQGRFRSRQHPDGEG